MITGALYLSRTFLSRFGLLLFSFLVLFQIFDMMASGEDIISRNGSIEALFRYAILRVPEIVTQTLPFTVLLAALLTLAGLAQHNEIVVLKSAGISFFQLLIMLAPIGLGIGLAHFVLSDQVVPRLSPWVELLRDPQGREVEASTIGGGIWLRDTGAVVSMQRASRDGRAIEEVSVFERDEQGKLRSMLWARNGQFRDGQWTLHDVRRLEPGAPKQLLPEMEWSTGVKPAQLSALAAHPSLLALKQILRFIRTPEVGARPIYVYETWLQERISLLLKPILMILLAAPAANLTRRHAGMAGSLGYGIAAGFAYFVADGLGLAFGEAGKLPPLIAAWAPGVIFAAFGSFIVLQVER
ncbi:MAG TPA: LPS export ABC transporter permease LptG [Alphaproteobacteria bacterium]|nr:LPS export ABC transporter permease LptG [Alphaproteobacteria bacterium]